MRRRLHRWAEVRKSLDSGHPAGNWPGQERWRFDRSDLDTVSDLGPLRPPPITCCPLARLMPLRGIHAARTGLSWYRCSYVPSLGASEKQDFRSQFASCARQYGSHRVVSIHPQMTAGRQLAKHAITLIYPTRIRYSYTEAHHGSPFHARRTRGRAFCRRVPR